VATYSAQELLKRWEQGILTVEQAIGHILQHLAAQHKQAPEPKLKKPPKPPSDED
jgi:hypothetical protein